MWDVRTPHARKDSMQLAPVGQRTIDGIADSSSNKHEKPRGWKLLAGGLIGGGLGAYAFDRIYLDAANHTSHSRLAADAIGAALGGLLGLLVVYAFSR